MIRQADIAKEIFARSLDDWRPHGCEIQVEYGLTQVQFNPVKRKVRAVAIEHGIVWGYHPDYDVYMLAPQGSPEIARPILLYSFRHWREAGYAAKQTADMAMRAHVITEMQMARIDAVYSAFDSLIAPVLQSMGYPAEAYESEAA